MPDDHEGKDEGQGQGEDVLGVSNPVLDAPAEGEAPGEVASEEPTILAMPLPGLLSLPAPVPTHKGGKLNKGYKRDQLAILHVERRQAALQLRRRGYAISDIAALLNISMEAARKLVRAALRKLARIDREDVAEVCRLELARLDLAVRRIMEQLEDETSSPTVVHQAVDRLVALQKRRAELLGLDGSAPRQSTADERARITLAPMIQGATHDELLELRALFEKAAARQKADKQALERPPRSPEEPAS